MTVKKWSSTAAANGWCRRTSSLLMLVESSEAQRDVPCASPARLLKIDVERTSQSGYEEIESLPELPLVQGYQSWGL